MRPLLRFLLRVVALLLIAGAVYLVILKPNANVVGADLVTKVNVTVQCSSVWDQWTHHAQPAALKLNGNSVASLQAAQGSCQSASHKIKIVGAAMTGGGVIAFVVSFLLRQVRR